MNHSGNSKKTEKQSILNDPNIIAKVEENDNWQVFQVEGFDPSKFRLAISKQSNYWSFVGWDDRDLWFHLGDRADLRQASIFKAHLTSWSDSAEALKSGFSDPHDWLDFMVWMTKNT